MKIGFIGVGNMGGAILKGALSQGYIQAENTIIYDISEAKIKEVTALFPVHVAKTHDELALWADCIVLGVKPIFLQSVLEKVKPYVAGKRLLSIAAGWSLAMLQESVGDDAVEIMRVMPNTPALVGAGYTAICEESTFSGDSFAWGCGLFACLGRAEVLPERLIEAVIVVAGSSPAYVCMLIDAMADGAVKQGMPRAQAIQAAAQAVMGTAKMVLETGEHPAVLKDAVCSPAGTTIEAVETLEKYGFRGAVLRAMEACADKSRAMVKAQEGK